TPPLVVEHAKTAIPPGGGSPAVSSANDAIASKPRKDSTAIETAPAMATGWTPVVPMNGAADGLAGPLDDRTTTAATTNTARTTSSAITTIVPARAATPTPDRFNAVVTVNAATVKVHAGTAGTSACSAMPEKRYATEG